MRGGADMHNVKRKGHAQCDRHNVRMRSMLNVTLTIS